MSLEHPAIGQTSSGGGGPRVAVREPVTLATLRQMAARGEPFAALACYEAMTARWLERAGVHVLLAGDSAAEIVLGYPRTLHMPLDMAVWLCAALKRGAPSTLVMGDVPFMALHAGEAEALRNTARFMTEGLADVVKLEAGEGEAPLVEKLTRAGVPVCGHVGLRPQQVMLEGRYRSKGRKAGEAERVVQDAVALERAGAVLLLVEAVPDEVTAAILDRTSVPLIGIGAGDACHGQILVLHDLVGMTDQPPRFAEPLASMGPAMQQAGAEWVKRVRQRTIGGKRYTMPEEERRKLRTGTA